LDTVLVWDTLKSEALEDWVDEICDEVSPASRDLTNQVSGNIGNGEVEGRSLVEVVKLKRSRWADGGPDTIDKYLNLAASPVRNVW
jgi:hypothetical protein